MTREHITAQTDGNLITLSQPRQSVSGLQLTGFSGPNGRCVVAFNAPFSRISNLLLHAGGDDAISIGGYSNGTVVLGCEAMASNWRDSKAIIGYCGQKSSAPGPMFGADVGYAGQIIGCKLQGSHFAGRFRDGVWQIVDNDIYISSLSALDFIDPCRANVIGNRFHYTDKPDDPRVGKPIRLYRIVGDTYPQTNLKSRLYFSGNILNGQSIDGPGLVPGVASTVFRKTPN